MGSFLSSRVVEDGWKSDARFAMESGSFCVICGGQFDMEGNAYNIDPKSENHQWLCDFRIVGDLSDIVNHNMTGEQVIPVNTAEHDDVFLSKPASFSTTHSDYFRVGGDAYGGDVWFDPLRADANDGTVFALHHACIDIGRKVIAIHQASQTNHEPISTLAILNRLLQHRFRRAADATQGLANDLLDLCVTSEAYGPRSVLALSKLEWWGGEYEKFLADPMHVPTLASFILDVLQTTPNWKEDDKCTPRPMREPCGLELLPPEIFDQICTHLPASSAIRLHRVSKTLALKVPVSNSFWRKGLLDGSLLPHIWDLDMKEIRKPVFEDTCDWKSVARLLSTKRMPLFGGDVRLESIPQGLWNRCRIWSIMEEAVDFYCSNPSPRSRRDNAIESTKRFTPVQACKLEDVSEEFE